MGDWQSDFILKKTTLRDGCALGNSTYDSVVGLDRILLLSCIVTSRWQLWNAKIVSSKSKNWSRVAEIVNAKRKILYRLGWKITVVLTIEPHNGVYIHSLISSSHMSFAWLFLITSLVICHSNMGFQFKNSDDIRSISLYWVLFIWILPLTSHTPYQHEIPSHYFGRYQS